MSKSLFDNFDEVSAKQWKQKIQFDLKGADYNEALIHKSLEGIDIKPFYHQEDKSEISIPLFNSSSSYWKNSLKIEVADPIIGDQKVLEALKKGAESIHFVITNQNVEPAQLLKNIPIDIPVYIETQFLSIAYVQEINAIAQNKKLIIYVLTDIIGNLGRTGNWYSNLKNDHLAFDEIVKCKNLASTISIDLDLYQNSGATMIQQLGYSLAHANEYLNHCNESNSSILKETPIVFKVAVGGNYFFEIAKLKALRVLWNTLAKAYDINPQCHVIAYPTHRNKTFLDYNVNMLRTTTECMSAILGEANTIQNLPYDTIYNLENEFGTRIAINQLLILKKESYFDLVTNPTSGAYYIESITEQMAEKALSLFKNIETGGGFLKQLKSGVIQKKIKESSEKEQELFDNEEIVLTGVNTYQNKNETTPNFEKPVFEKKNVRKTLISPIITRRLPYKKETETVQN